MKCGRLGCEKEASKAMVPILGGMAMAEVVGCPEHFKEIVASLP